MIDMVVLAAAAALVATPPQPRPVSAAVQATATIRIIAGVQLKLDGTNSPGAPSPRESVVKSADGSARRVRLIEFQ